MNRVLSLSALVLLLVGIVLPLAWLAAGDADALQAMRTQLLDPSLREAFLRSVAVALLACGLCAVFALPAGLAFARLTPYPRRTLLLIGLLPLFLPAMATASLLRGHGIELTGLSDIVSLPAVGFGPADFQLTLVYALHFFPLLVLTMAATARRRLQSAEQAANALGIGRWRTWRRITLPLLLPGFLLGAGLMLLRILEDVATPLLFGIDGMLAPQLLLQMQDAATGAGPRVFAILLLAASSLVLLLSWQAFLPPLQTPHDTAAALPPRTAGSVQRLMQLLIVPPSAALALLPAMGLLSLALAPADVLSLGDARSLPDGLLHALARTLLYAIFAGLLSLVATNLFGLAVAGRHAASRLGRATVTLLVALPGPVLALAWLYGLYDGFTGDIDVGWLLLATLVAVKLLPVGSYLFACRARALRPALRDVSRSLGEVPASRFHSAAFGTLGNTRLLVFVLAVAAFVAELPAALLLLPVQDGPLVAYWFDALRNDGAWQTAALLSLALAAGMLCVAACLWHALGRTRDRYSYRYRDTLQAS